MLQELVVENYAVVDRLRVRFHEGLNLLTGETGSGKSIVVDALGLLLGGRACGTRGLRVGVGGQARAEAGRPQQGRRAAGSPAPRSFPAFPVV